MSILYVLFCHFNFILNIVKPIKIRFESSLDLTLIWLVSFIWINSIDSIP